MKPTIILWCSQYDEINKAPLFIPWLEKAGFNVKVTSSVDELSTLDGDLLYYLTGYMLPIGSRSYNILLEQEDRFVVPNKMVDIKLALDKYTTYEQAVACGLPTPKMLALDGTPEECYEIVNNFLMEFPEIVIKNRYGWCGKGLYAIKKIGNKFLVKVSFSDLPNISNNYLIFNKSELITLLSHLLQKRKLIAQHYITTKGELDIGLHEACRAVKIGDEYFISSMLATKSTHTTVTDEINNNTIVYREFTYKDNLHHITEIFDKFDTNLKTYALDLLPTDPLLYPELIKDDNPFLFLECESIFNFNYDQRWVLKVVNSIFDVAKAKIDYLPRIDINGNSIGHEERFNMTAKEFHKFLE